MNSENEQKPSKEVLDEFFSDLNRFGWDYIQWTGETPNILAINPEIMARLAREEGFYQREEVRNVEVTAHSPMVRRFNLQFGVVTIREDYEERFLHFEQL